MQTRTVVFPQVDSGQLVMPSSDNSNTLVKHFTIFTDYQNYLLQCRPIVGYKGLSTLGISNNYIKLCLITILFQTCYQVDLPCYTICVQIREERLGLQFLRSRRKAEILMLFIFVPCTFPFYLISRLVYAGHKELSFLNFHHLNSFLSSVLFASFEYYIIGHICLQ